MSGKGSVTSAARFKYSSAGSRHSLELVCITFRPLPLLPLSGKALPSHLWSYGVVNKPASRQIMLPEEGGHSSRLTSAALAKSNGGTIGRGRFWGHT